MSTRSLETRVLGPIAALAILLAACSSGANVTTAPTASAPPPTTAASTPASAPTSSPTTSASTVQAIPDGTYETAPIQVSDIVALINADTKLSATEKTDLINGFQGHTTTVDTLDLHAGKYRQGQRVDGGANDVGSEGSYAFPDAHTLVLQETCCPGITTFHVSAVPSGFTLKRTDKVTDEGEVIISKVLFQWAPFTRMP